MTRNLRFQYELQPILLRRRWDLDALKVDLNKINESLKQVSQERAELHVEAEAVGREWKNQSISSGCIGVERFSMVIYYLDDLGRQMKDRDIKRNELERERDLIIDRIALAQRGLEAIEQHRDEMHERFLKQRTNMEFKLADDHWSTLQTNMENHDH